MPKIVVGVFCALLFLTPAAGDASCTCDCDGDDIVSISELIRIVGVALGNQPVSSCPGALDRCTDGRICIGEIVRCVSQALLGCSPDSTPTTRTPTPTPPLCGIPTACAPGAALVETPGACPFCATFTATPTDTTTPTACAVPTGCAGSAVLVQTPGSCPFCATFTRTPCSVPTCPTFTVPLAVDGGCPRCVTPSPTRTRTPTCAPTGTPYCSEICEPCPTIRAGCNQFKCGRCVTPPVCADNEACIPGQGFAGCCGCRTKTPTPLA